MFVTRETVTTHGGSTFEAADTVLARVAGPGAAVTGSGVAEAVGVTAAAKAAKAATAVAARSVLPSTAARRRATVT